MLVEFTDPVNRFLSPNTHLPLDGDTTIAVEHASNTDSHTKRLRREASRRYYHSHLHICRQKSRQKAEQ
jgi:hypothetical protein